MENEYASFGGLSSREANDRLERYGRNELIEQEKSSALILLLRALNNPLVFVLLGAALLSAFLGETINALIIISMVLLSTVLDFLNSYKAEQAVHALQERVKLTVLALRDGKQREIDLSLVVPDDVILLLPGDLVPADGSILNAEDFFVNESSLTGESFPVEKRASEPVMMGTSVVTGKALMRAEKTGTATRFSSIAQRVAQADAPTEFDRGVRSFSALIVRIIIVLVTFIFVANAIGKHSFLDSFLFALALAVGMTPELLPMIITLNLSHGSLAMARRGIIVKKLSAIQNFGSMDVLCTDKTGTLTQDKIVLVTCVDKDGKESEDVLRFAYLNSVFHTAMKSPLDKAIQERASSSIHVAQWNKSEEIPFDFERRRDSILVDHASERFMITKGAPEEVLRVCSEWGDARHPRTLDDAIRRDIMRQYESLSKNGFRTLAVAVRLVQDRKSSYHAEDEHNLVFIGFAAFLDPPKKTAGQALQAMRRYGVAIKVLTGDNEFVARNVAEQIGLAIQGVFQGSDIAAMDDARLRSAVEEGTLFTRLLPEQKTKIISALQRNGHTVGYLGDGINDAPSLKAADVGVSVDNAVDVAKESADFILLKKNLQDLAEGIPEGRRTMENTLKYMMMALSSNFGNMISMAGASLFLPFLPLLPGQILLNNFLYDASQFTIAVDAVDPEAVRKPRSWDMGFIKKYMLVFGLISSAFDFLTFWILFSVFKASGAAFQTGWFLESLATQTLVIYFIRTRGLLFEKSAPHPALITSSVVAVAAGIAIALSAPGSWFFGFTGLPGNLLLMIALIVAGYLAIVEIAKRILFRMAHFT